MATADCGGLAGQATARSVDDVDAMAEVTWWLDPRNSAMLRGSLAAVELLWPVGATSCSIAVVTILCNCGLSTMWAGAEGSGAMGMLRSVVVVTILCNGYSSTVWAGAKGSGAVSLLRLDIARSGLGPRRDSE